jgi:hypothetical protein
MRSRDFIFFFSLFLLALFVAYIVWRVEYVVSLGGNPCRLCEAEYNATCWSVRWVG